MSSCIYGSGMRDALFVVRCSLELFSYTSLLEISTRSVLFKRKCNQHRSGNYPVMKHLRDICPWKYLYYTWCFLSENRSRIVQCKFSNMLVFPTDFPYTLTSVLFSMEYFKLNLDEHLRVSHRLIIIPVIVLGHVS